jgi:hypothetical protein
MRPVFVFHDDLNPKLWQNDSLKPIVRLKLLQAALTFYQFLDVAKLQIKDIILTGSNAGFNYTPLSDIDVHLVVDMSSSVCAMLADNLFLTKKALWGQTYDVEIFGLPVELYVEDVNQPVKANGVFSLLKNEWLKQPSAVRPHPDDSAVRHKYAGYKAMIENMVNGEPAIQQIDDLLARLKRFRQAGLLAGGEFSNENSTYKMLRDDGLLQQLYDKRIAMQDGVLSLK